MNILLIGNGFDVAHGLPTQYIDFLNFVVSFKCYRNKKVCDSNLKDYFDQHLEEIYQIELDKCIENNKWLDHFLHVYEERLSSEKNGWIDFENEISSVVQALDRAEEYSTIQFEKGKTDAMLEFKEWYYLGFLLFKETDFEKAYFDRLDVNSISNTKLKLEKDLEKLIRALEIYLSTYVNHILISKLNIEKDHCDFSKMNISFIINFNYTNTYNILYKTDRNFVQQCHVHGSAELNHKTRMTNMVLGIDEYLDDDKKDEENRFYVFKKFYQRIMKETDTSYQDVLDYINNLEPDPRDKEPIYHNLYIYGHSLDITDKDILSSFILADKVNTFIYYHNEKSKKKLIGNLIKIIGQDELIKRTKGEKRTINFVSNTTDLEYSEKYPYDHVAMLINKMVADTY